MKLETFFQKFDQFADAPDAVEKMRELILLLALDGKIGDTTAATWERVQLGDLGEWGSGGTPLSTESRYYDGNIPWLIIGDLNDGVVTSSTKTITEEGLANSSARMLPKNVLLIAMYGSIGKLGITGIECATNQAIAFCKPDPDRADLRYLFHAFMGLRPKFLSRGQGLAQKNISQRILRAWEIGLPPLAEQKRIVAKVNELMALCDRLEAQQQQQETRHAALARASLARFAEAPTPANLPFLFHPSYAIPPADLRKSILTLAVQGKLVPQDPNDEPAEKCLSRLGLESTFVPPEGDDSENDSLPPAWARVRFEDIALVAGGVTLGRKLGDRKTVNLPYLRVANVKRGEIDLSVIKEVSIAEDEIERYALRENDLLMTEGGDWDKVGRAAIWKAEIPVCLHQNHVFRARMRSAELAPFWFERYFNSPVGRGYFESASKQTTNLASINMRQVRSCPIPLPPLAEQRRIVAKVEQLMALVEALETQLAASRATAANLLSALVAELTASRLPANP